MLDIVVSRDLTVVLIDQIDFQGSIVGAVGVVAQNQKQLQWHSSVFLSNLSQSHTLTYRKASKKKNENNCKQFREKVKPLSYNSFFFFGNKVAVFLVTR